MSLSIWVATMQVTLLEATKKKCAFLEEVTAALQLTNVHVIWQRAEEAGTSPQLREAGGTSSRYHIAHALCFCRAARGRRGGDGRGGERCFGSKHDSRTSTESLRRITSQNNLIWHQDSLLCTSSRCISIGEACCMKGLPWVRGNLSSIALWAGRSGRIALDSNGQSA